MSDFDDELNALLNTPDEEEGSSSAPDMIIEEAIDVPRQSKVIELDVQNIEGDPDPLAALRYAGEQARGALDGNVFFSKPIADVASDTAELTPAQIARGAATGFVNGYISGAAKSVPKGLTAAGYPQLEEAIAPLVEQDATAKAETPGLYEAADVIGSAYSPVNKLLGYGLKGLKGGGRFIADLGSQIAQGAGDTFSRVYGETGDAGAAGDAAGTSAWISGLLGVPFAAAGATGSSAAARARDPETVALRQDEYRKERLRSAGLPNGAIDSAEAADKERYAVALIEELAAKRGAPAESVTLGMTPPGYGPSGPSSAYTVPQMARQIELDAARSGAAKDQAISALAAQDATVDPNLVAGGLRAEKRPQVVGAPLVAEKNAVLEGMAQGYDVPPAPAYLQDDTIQLDAVPEYAYPQQQAVPPPLPPRAAPTQPPPLPAAPAPGPAASAPAMPAAPPARPSARAPQSQVYDIAPEDLTPVRPSARAQPQPPPVAPEAPPPPDPVGALAAQGNAPPPPEDLALLMEQDMLPHLEQTPGAMSPDELIEREIAAELERSSMGGPPPPRPSARASQDPYLYHSTRASNIPAIQREGLLPRAQQSTPGPSPYVQSVLDSEALGATLSPEVLAEIAAMFPRKDYPDGVWFADESGRSGWKSQLAEDSNLPPEDLRTLRVLRANAGTQYNPRLNEHFTEQGIPPTQLEIQGPGGGWYQMPQARPSARYNPALDPTNRPAPAQPPSLPQQPRMAAPAGPPPLPPPPPEEFVRGIPMPPELAAVQRRAPWREYLEGENKYAGQAIPNGTPPTAANEFKRQRYAASMDALRAGAAETDPAMAAQWDGNNMRQGLDLLLQKEAAKARNVQAPPVVNYPDTKLSLMGGSFGAGIGGLIGGAVGAGIGGPIGMAGGLAASRWLKPREHSLRANWLSGDTAARADRLAGYGEKPVGSLVSSFGDLMRDPPPEPESDPSDPSGPTSALSPGEFLGRDTTQAMLSDPEVFRLYADDYSQAGTDDKRAAVTERLYRTDPEFARNVFPRIQGGEIA